MHLIKWSFNKMGREYICSNSLKSFLRTKKKKHKNYVNWTSFNMLTALEFLLDNNFVRFDETVYRQVIGIPMRTNCAPLIADLFLYCYESQFMARRNKGLSKQHLLDKFNNIFRCLDDSLALNNNNQHSY